LSGTGATGGGGGGPKFCRGPGTAGPQTGGEKSGRGKFSKLAVTPGAGKRIEIGLRGVRRFPKTPPRRVGRGRDTRHPKRTDARWGGGGGGGGTRGTGAKNHSRPGKFLHPAVGAVSGGGIPAFGDGAPKILPRTVHAPHRWAQSKNKGGGPEGGDTDFSKSGAGMGGFVGGGPGSGGRGTCWAQKKCGPAIFRSGGGRVGGIREKPPGLLSRGRIIPVFV